MTLGHAVCAHVSTERVCERCFRHQYVLDVCFTHVTGRSNRYHASRSYTVYSDWLSFVTSDKVPDLGRSESDLDPSESDLGKCCHKSLVHDHGSGRLIKVTET